MFAVSKQLKRSYQGTSVKKRCLERVQSKIDRYDRDCEEHSERACELKVKYTVTARL
jgi:hypothetical protein